MKTLKQLKRSETEIQEDNGAHSDNSNNLSSDEDIESFVSRRTSAEPNVEQPVVNSSLSKRRSC